MTQVFFDSAALGVGFSSLAQRTLPSVVQLRGAGRGSGTGVVWGVDGMVLTNDHVIAGTRDETRVQTFDGRDLAVEVIARSQELDLALLRLPVADLPPVSLGDSARLRVGELVFAIGHPWGQPWVVTGGIISGVGEAEARDGGKRLPFIRSDVRLAPGNSGGPLLNAGGEVIGINAMVFGGDLAIAIPSRTARDWIASVSGRRARLGLSVQPSPLPPGAPEGRSSGLLVIDIEAGGAAERAELLVGDLLLEAEEQALDQPTDLRDILRRQPAGAPIRLLLLRGGAVMVVHVTAFSE